MKYSEATKAIKYLSKKYSVLNEGDYNVLYNGSTVLRVLKHKQYGFEINFDKSYFEINFDKSYFDGLPFSHKLWMIASELAMTPLDKREEEHKWNVIVGNDHSSFDPLILWEKGYDDKEPFVLNIGNMQSVSDQAIFNDYEYNRLIKYIKTLPDGEWQATVAEHGKTLVKGE